MDEMILYHFTDDAGIAGIRAIGSIAPAHLAIPGGGQTPAVVSLTTNPDPNKLIGKSLTDGSRLSGKNLAAYRASINDPNAPAPTTRRTCGCRVRLRIPNGDILLHKLDAIAQKLGFSSTQLEDFMRLGGGHPNAWWIYQGGIPIELVEEIRSDYPKFDCVM